MSFENCLLIVQTQKLLQHSEYLWSSQFRQSRNDNILKPSKSDLIPAIFKIKTNWSVTSRKIF